MQNYCKTIGALAAASALAAGNVQAEVEYDLHTGYSNEYLFRGLDLGTNLVEAGANVATEFGDGFGWSAGAWYGSYDASNPAGGGALNADELDLFTEFSKDFGFATASVGYIAYLYPQGKGSKAALNLDDVQEISFGVSRDFDIVNVSFNYYLAVEGDNYGYMELDLNRSFELNQCLNLVVDTNVGYLGDEGSFTAWTSRVALDWNFAGQAKFSPFVAFAVGDRNRSDFTVASGNPYRTSGNEILGGAMLSVGF